MLLALGILVLTDRSTRLQLPLLQMAGLDEGGPFLVSATAEAL